VSLPGVTADAGFLIALERSKARALALLRSARLRRSRVVVPVAVLAEWWRGSPDQARILRPFNVEPMSESLAKTAGEALAAVARATVVDAIVMASASSSRRSRSTSSSSSARSGALRLVWCASRRAR
jgi:hypothetical protein